MTPEGSRNASAVGMPVTNLKSADCDEIPQGGKCGGDAGEIEVAWIRDARTSPSRVSSQDFLETSGNQCVFQGDIGGRSPRDEGSGVSKIRHWVKLFRTCSDRR